MITTMRQIAEYSGYSLTAVSMALNENGGACLSHEARNIIIESAMRLGYQHHAPVPIPQLTDGERGWLAGIVDGEGCITITRTSPSKNTTHRTIQYRPYITVTMGHAPTIARVRELIGVGSGDIQTLSTNPKWNDAYRWYASNRHAITAVKAIRPYLVTKAEEADVILEWSLLPNIRTGRAGILPELLAERERLFNKIKLLKPKNNTQHAMENRS